MSRHFKQVLSLALALAMVAGCLGALAEGSIALPSSLTSIGDSAFEGIGATVVTIPEGLDSLGSLSFANSDVKLAILPGELPRELPESTEDNPFKDANGITLSAPRFSAALEWAQSCGFKTVYRGYEYDEPDVLSVAVTNLGNSWYATVCTSLGADTLELYASDGETRLATFNDGYSDIGYQRVWNVSYDPQGQDDGNYLFRAVNSCGEYADARSGADYAFQVASDALGLINSFMLSYSGSSQPFREVIFKGDSFAFDFALNETAYARLVNASGEPLSEIKRCDVDVSDNSPDSFVLVPFNSFDQTGTFDIYLQASKVSDMSNYVEYPQSFQIEVIDTVQATGIIPDEMILINQPAQFLVTHSPDAKYVRLYKGTTVLAQAEVDEGYEDFDGSIVETRETSLPYKFTAAGTYTVTAKASPDNKDWSDPGVSCTVKVQTYPWVESLDGYTGYSEENPEAIAAYGNRLCFTTHKSATYAALFDESNAKKLTWTASATNSYIDEFDGLRHWTVDCKYPTAGQFKYTLKASANNTNYGAGVSFRMNVVSKPRVYSYAFDSDVQGSGVLADLTIDVPYAVQKAAVYDAAGTTKLAEMAIPSVAEEDDEWSESNGEPEDPYGFCACKTFAARLSFADDGWRAVTVKLSLDGKNYSFSETLPVDLPTRTDVVAMDSECTFERDLSAEFGGYCESDGVLAQLSALRMLDASSTMLHQWNREDILIPEEDNSNCSFYLGYQFAASGKHTLRFEYRLDGWEEDSWATAGILCVDVPAALPETELASVWNVADLAEREGQFKLVRTSICTNSVDENSGCFLEDTHAAYTTIENPGRFYLLEDEQDNASRDGTVSWYKLCDAGCGYTLCGMKPGMTRSAARTAATRFGLTFWNTDRLGITVANLDCYCCDNPLCPFYYVWVQYDTKGIVTQIYAGSGAGE